MNKFVLAFLVVNGLFLGLILRDGHMTLHLKFQALFFCSCFALLLYLFENYFEEYRKKEVIKK